MTTRFHLRPPVEEMVFQLYGRPLHPELFDLLATRRIEQRDFTLDLWLTTAGHAISWHGPQQHLTEVVAGGPDLPDWGQLINHRLQGERCDKRNNLDGVCYQVSFQVESLLPNQFLSVHQEILADGGREGLMHSFTTNHRWSLSPVDAIFVDDLERGLLLTCFHTFPDEYTVIKSQSLIERE